MKNKIIQVVHWILVCGRFDLLQSQGKSRHRNHESSLRACTLVYTEETQRTVRLCSWHGCQQTYLHHCSGH